MVPSNDDFTQGCPASPAAFSFLIMLVQEFFWPEVVARAGVEAKEAIDLFDYWGTTSRWSPRRDLWKTPPEQWKPPSRRPDWS